MIHATYFFTDDTTLDLTEAEMKRIFNNEQNKELLKNELEPRRLIDNLLESGALSFDDHEDVQQTAHRYQRVIALLMYIRSDVLKKGPVFLKAIKANYPKLMKKLTDNLHTSGCEGGFEFLFNSSSQTSPGFYVSAVEVF